MILDFTLSGSDSMALTEEYLSNSPSHQRSRARVRWVVPVLLSLLLAISFIRKGPELTTALIFSVGIFGWLIFYPLRFDARVRKSARAQMEESSYAKNFGQYRLEITDDSLVSSGPTGKFEYTWASVDRIVLTSDYLFVFFAGLSGLPISVVQIGAETAQSTYDLLGSKRNAAA